MIRCSCCGTMMRHDWEGHYDAGDGAFLCNGCYTPELHPDLDDAYDETDRTAKHTDIGGVE